jgi:hypothetical protein
MFFCFTSLKANSIGFFLLFFNFKKSIASKEIEGIRQKAANVSEISGNNTFSILRDPFWVDRNFRRAVRSPGERTLFEFDFQKSIHKISKEFNHTTFDNFIRFTKIIDNNIEFEKKRTIVRKYISLKNDLKPSIKSIAIGVFEEYYSLSITETCRIGDLRKTMGV